MNLYLHFWHSAHSLILSKLYSDPDALSTLYSYADALSKLYSDAGALWKLYSDASALWKLYSDPGALSPLFLTLSVRCITTVLRNNLSAVVCRSVKPLWADSKHFKQQRCSLKKGPLLQSDQIGARLLGKQRLWLGE